MKLIERLKNSADKSKNRYIEIEYTDGYTYYVSDACGDAVVFLNRLKNRDFGEIKETVEGSTVACKAMVPGLSMHDLVMIYESAYKTGNDLAGNPAKWPTVKGINAVLDAVFQALTTDEPAKKYGVYITQGQGVGLVGRFNTLEDALETVKWLEIRDNNGSYGIQYPDGSWHDWASTGRLESTEQRE